MGCGGRWSDAGCGWVGCRTQSDSLKTWGIPLQVFLPHLLALAQPVQCGVAQGFQEFGPGPFPKGWDSQRMLRIAFILLLQLGLHSRGHSPGIKEGKVSAEEHVAALTAEVQIGFPGIWLFNELLLLTAAPHAPWQSQLSPGTRGCLS